MAGYFTTERSRYVADVHHRRLLVGRAAPDVNEKRLSEQRTKVIRSSRREEGINFGAYLSTAAI